MAFSPIAQPENEPWNVDRILSFVRDDWLVAAEAVVEIDGISKSYGEVLAVDDVTFTVARGEICGLLGPNGAGKTTTLRILVGLQRPSRGQARLFGQPVVASAPELARVGAMIEQAAFVPHASGRDNLRWWWEAAGVSMASADLEFALHIADLGNAIDRAVKTYSQGMKQRLGFARLLLGRPELLVLDEPTNGLDPGEIREIREMLKRLSASGATVLLSSHHLDEVQQVCTTAVVMDRGRLVSSGTVEGLLTGRGVVRIEVDNVALATDVLRALPAVRDVEADGSEIYVHASGLRSDLVTALVHAGVRVETVTAQQRLEDAFLGIIEEGQPV
jgi:ABC-2 type transport system ATP-binding protein